MNRANGQIQPQSTDEAWAKLQKKLEDEPVNPVWATWGKQDTLLEEQAAKTDRSDRTELAADEVLPAATADNLAAAEPLQNTGRKSRRPMMSRSRKWAAAAAGVAIFAAILATPVGNTAMAALLNQFKMQEATVVEEGDLRDMFYQITENGNDRNIEKSLEAFGDVSITNGEVKENIALKDIQGLLGYEPLKGAVMDSVKFVRVSGSHDITLNLKVDEVNKALKRLGSDNLLPASVDGKPITLHIPEQVNYDLGSDQHWGALSQMNTPVVTVDPSVDLDEAVDAVVNFPLIPDNLRSSLQKSRILSGDLPMPLIKGNHDEQITVAGTPVILTEMKYSNGNSYTAVWVKKGQLLQFYGGDIYPDREQFIQKVQELITQ
ncbi:hypothetical protein [Paenibacillus sp. FSL R7-0337]|uniref:hypothetical protein n=1 Tax=Paenibacillus sp. FSL R7-0337 TaxID=1926588 RepID=UPI00096C57C8|nr:hypothetical protein [Paenibacillus sp. FSL R7-0337]OMG01171.1 hypothetical protein BK147_02115 [Paenibacillus sp. FSL R7-0337]